MELIYYKYNKEPPEIIKVVSINNNYYYKGMPVNKNNLYSLLEWEYLNHLHNKELDNG